MNVGKPTKIHIIEPREIPVPSPLPPMPKPQPAQPAKEPVPA
jgi:hypothetical protein